MLVESGDAEGPGFGFYRLTLDSGSTELLARVPREVSSGYLSLMVERSSMYSTQTMDRG